MKYCLSNHSAALHRLDVARLHSFVPAFSADTATGESHLSDDRSILVVSLDPETRSEIAGLFTAEGFRTLEVAECEAAGDLLVGEVVDLVVLDERLSAGRAYSFCRKLAVDGGAPVILLSDNADVVSRIVALEVGADDLIATPVDSRLLLAQARALMRRSGAVRNQRPRSLSASGRWALDPVAREAVGPDGARLPLSPQEVSLMDMFLGNPGVVFTPENAVEWIPTLKQDTTVGFRTAMSRLRRKLGNSDFGAAIRTVRGAGYVYASATH